MCTTLFVNVGTRIDDEGFMSGDTEPGDTMIDDEDYDTGL